MIMIVCAKRGINDCYGSLNYLNIYNISIIYGVFYNKSYFSNICCYYVFIYVIDYFLQIANVVQTTELCNK